MMTLDTAATFFGWCTVINVGFIVVALVAIALMHDFAGDMAAKTFGIDRDQAKLVVFSVIQHYRIAVLFLNFVPYLALKIMVAA
tara:strand:+ start:306 stop:557 length:252 start_codon:yes stop_codon:yes gene_type:complete